MDTYSNQKVALAGKTSNERQIIMVVRFGPLVSVSRIVLSSVANVVRCESVFHIVHLIRADSRQSVQQFDAILPIVFIFTRTHII